MRPLRNTLLHKLGSVSTFSTTSESNAGRVNRWWFGLIFYRQAPVVGIGARHVP